MPIIRGEITETVDISTNGTHNVAQYTSANVNVQPSISSLNVTPTTSAQQITAPQGTDGYSPVNVSAVTSSIDANITAGNIKNGVTILGVTGSYQGSGGSVEQMMWQEYGIATMIWTSDRAKFNFEDSGDEAPVDFAAWESAGLDFWDWFEQENGFREIRGTKFLSFVTDDESYYNYVLEIGAGSMVEDPELGEDVFVPVWTGRGGDLWLDQYFDDYFKFGFYLLDPQTFEPKTIMCKTTPSATAEERTLVFCFDDFLAAVSTHD